MDFKNFKKAQEDQHTVTMKHPDGHSIKVMKRALSPKLRGEIARLPLHASDGTPDEIQAPDSGSAPQAPVTINLNTANPSAPPQAPGPEFYKAAGLPVPPQMQGVPAPSNQPFSLGAMSPAVNPMAGLPDRVDSDNIPVVKASPTPSNQNPVDNSLVQQVAPSASAAQQAAAASAVMPTLDQSGLDLQMKGIKDQAAAEGKIAANQAGIYKATNTTLDDIIKQAQQSVKDHANEIDTTIKDIGDGHIDPQHYVNNLGTEGKIRTGIALFLGGLGAGLTKGPNLALEMLNNNINRDVEAQKASFANKLSGKRTMLDAFNQKFKDRESALNMTKALYTQKAINDINAAAADQGTAIASARAAQLTGPLLMQKNQNLYNVALRQAALGVGSGMDPSQQLTLKSQAGIIPQQEYGKVASEIDRMNSIHKESAHLADFFDTAAAENTIANRALHAGFAPQSVKNLENAMMPMLKDAEGRINETEIEQMRNYLPAPGDSEYKTQQKKEGMLKFAQQKARSSLLDSYGIKLPAPVIPTFHKR